MTEDRPDTTKSARSKSNEQHARETFERQNTETLATWTVDALLTVIGECGVCTGHSPGWDGHNIQPPCRGAARLEIESRARRLVTAAVANTVDELSDLRTLREEWLTLTTEFGFGDGVTEPAAMPHHLMEHLRHAFADAAEWVEAPRLCEGCGEWLATEVCTACKGSGCGPGTATGAYEECETCAGVTKVHPGCVGKSYADLVDARAEGYEAGKRDQMKRYAEDKGAFHDTLDSDIADSLRADREYVEAHDRSVAADAWDKGQRSGSDYERAKWYWQGGNRAMLAAMGWPVESPARPVNPYLPVVEPEPQPDPAILPPVQIEGFDAYCAEHNIQPGEDPAAFGAYLNSLSGWEGRIEQVAEGNQQAFLDEAEQAQTILRENRPAKPRRSWLDRLLGRP